MVKQWLLVAVAVAGCDPSLFFGDGGLRRDAAMDGGGGAGDRGTADAGVAGDAEATGDATPAGDAEAPGPAAFATVPEGFAHWEPLPAVEARRPAEQPGRIEPATTCAGGEVTLFPLADQAFPVGPDLKVLFAPCGIPGEVVAMAPDQIRVRVPDAATSGPVWVVLATGDAEGALKRGAGCVDEIRRHEVVTERPLLTCTEAVDPFAPDGATRLRGIPAARPFGEDQRPPAPEAPALARRVETPGEPGPCRIRQLSRRPALVLRGQDTPGVQVVRRGEDGLGCFETCDEIEVVGQPLPANHLTVQHAPLIERFVPEASQALAPRRHRVERGEVAFAWQITSDAGPAAAHLAIGEGVDGPVALEGREVAAVFVPAIARLSAENACGIRELDLEVEPVTTLRVTPRVVTLGPGETADLRIAVAAPLPTDLEVALDDSSGGLLGVDPARLVLPAGATEATVRVTAQARAARIGGDHLLGEVAARVAVPPVGTVVLDGFDPTRIRTRMNPPMPLVPGPGEALVRGRLRYRECIHPDLAPFEPGTTLDAEHCVLLAGAAVFKPVRRARVEIWDQAPLIDQLRAVVETNDDGVFEALVAPDGTYDVTVVASGPAGQVNLENDGFTWFWKPLGRPQAAAGGATLTFDHDFPKADARHFNALDVTLHGLDTALALHGTNPADADAVFHRISVIPGTSSSGVTLRMGQASHIWIGAGSFIFSDETLLHEYTHHLQHMSGTYQAWATMHDGCYCSVVAGPACWDRRRPPGTVDDAFDAGCWVNSAELAWFEGLPNWFALTAFEADAADRLTRSNLLLLGTRPGGRIFCPLAETPHFSHHNARITGAFVEDYVAGLLVELARRPVAQGGVILDEAAIEGLIFRILFDDLSHRAPTIADFEAAWLARVPGDTQLAPLMTTYQMR